MCIIPYTFHTVLELNTFVSKCWGSFRKCNFLQLVKEKLKVSTEVKRGVSPITQLLIWQPMLGYLKNYKLHSARDWHIFILSHHLVLYNFPFLSSQSVYFLEALKVEMGQLLLCQLLSLSSIILDFPNTTLLSEAARTKVLKFKLHKILKYSTLKTFLDNLLWKFWLI